jgi:hypothetical protein
MSNYTLSKAEVLVFAPAKRIVKQTVEIITIKEVGNAKGDRY